MVESKKTKKQTVQIENKGWFKQANTTKSPEVFPPEKNLQLNIIHQMLSSDTKQLTSCGLDCI